MPDSFDHCEALVREADKDRFIARREGMRTLREDGLEKVKRGVTSVGEVLRVLGASGGR